MLLTPSPCHKLSHHLGPPPPPSSVTYFMDGPYILYLKLICICVSGFRNWAVVNLSCFLSSYPACLLYSFRRRHSFIYSFIHSEDLYSAPSTDYYSFILKIYIALLQWTTTHSVILET